MKRFRLSFSLTLLVALLAVGGSALFFYPREIFKDPVQTHFALEYPSFATQDGLGNTFVIDKSLSRIVKLTPSGNLAWELDGQSLSEGQFFYAEELAVDHQGYLYVLNQVMQANGFYTAKEEVLRFTPDGYFDRVVGSRVYRPQEISTNNVTRGRNVGLRVVGKNILWYELGTEGVIENTVNIDTWRLSQRTILPIQDSMIYVTSVTRLDPATVVYTTKKGFLFKQSEGQPPVLLYSGDEHTTPGSLSVPWWTGVDLQGNILFSDVTRSQILKLDPTNGLSVALDNSLYKEATGDSFPYIYYTFSSTETGRLVTTNDNAVLAVNPQGRLETLLSGGKYTIFILAVRAALWVGMLAAVWATLWALLILYRVIFRRRVSLILKQLAVSLPLITVILGFVIWVLVQHFSGSYEKQSYDLISQAIQTISLSVNTESLDKIQKESDFMDSDYQVIRNELHKALNNNRDPWNSKFYFALHRIRDGKIYTAMYLNDGVGLYQPYTYLNDPNNLYWKAAQGNIVTSQASDAWGTWVFGVGPIYNADGKISALLEVGRDLYSFRQETSQLLWSLFPYVALGYLVLILLFVLSTWLFLAPLRNLRSGVNRIAQGQWDTSLPIQSTDEVGDLTVVFNRMTTYIRNYVEEIVTLSQGYRRFVPQEFLQFLEKERIEQIQLGDQIQQEMTVLFTDIRSFTSLSEKMTPKENFDFLNSYLSLVGPEVRKHEGFIDKYIGDAIMALFPRNPDDALQAAIEIIDRLSQFNDLQREGGRDPIQIGLGLHTGLLMLGILGEQERMEGTVISDNVNLASRLEGLTKFFDASILLSETTYAGLKNPDRYHFRNLGKVRVKGKRDPIGIYEVLDGLPASVKGIKSRCQKNLESGIEFYQKGKIEKAVAEFDMALHLSPTDTTSKIYKALCRQVSEDALPEKWTGAIVMNSK